MTSETKHFIETHINQIENNGIGSTYLDCHLHFLTHMFIRGEKIK